MSIYFQNVASIQPASQPRTSLVNFARSPRIIQIPQVDDILRGDRYGRDDARMGEFGDPES